MEKLDCYKTIPIFRQYVLVSSTRKLIEVQTRLSEVEWLRHVYREGDKTLTINDCQILLEEVYDQIEFES